MLRLIVSSSSKPSPTSLLIRRIAPALALSDRQHWFKAKNRRDSRKEKLQVTQA